MSTAALTPTQQLFGTLLALLIVAAIIYFVVWLVKRLSNGSSDRVIENDREVITEQTVVRSAPTQTFSTGGPNMIATPSMGGMGDGAGAGARISGGGVKH